MAASAGHLSVDILMSSLAVILTALSNEYEIGLAQIGFASLIYTGVGSITQPIFGIIADKLRGRWIGPLSVLWLLICYTFIPLTSTYAQLVGLLAVGALGSAALHASGMLLASDAGKGKPTLATSIFFLGGQSGLALGPILAGYVMGYIGVRGLPLLVVFPVVATVMMFMYLRAPIHIVENLPSAPNPSAGVGNRIGWSIAGTFTLLILLRSATLHSLMIFLPKFLAEQGYTSAQYGLMTGIFVGGGAIGTFLGGSLGDRYNRRLIIFTSSLLAVPFCYLLLGSTGWLFLVTAALSGLILSIPHSIIIVMGQALLPKRKGMMGGLVLGFMFLSGSIAAWIAGIAADRVGLPAVLYFLAFMPIVAGGSALLLPRTRRPIPHRRVVPVSGD